MSRLLIAGTGALATLFASRLASAGYEVWMLGSWTQAMTALNAQGACIRLPDGSRRCAPVRAVARVEDCPSVRQALVLVKSWQTARTAAWLSQTLTDDGLALSLQNGLGNLETLQKTLGAARAALGVTTTGAAIVAPGVVRLGGEGLVSVESHPRGEGWVSALRRAGFQVEIVPDAARLAWRKLAVNAAINPLTALLEVPNGALLTLPGIPSLMDELAQETAAVAAAAGIHLNEDVAALARQVAAATAANDSSMLQDIRRGAPTEIEAICGAVARLGRERQVAVPRNEIMWRLVQAKAAKGGKITPDRFSSGRR